jgi:hypothetical protein
MCHDLLNMDGNKYVHEVSLHIGFCFPPLCSLFSLFPPFLSSVFIFMDNIIFHIRFPAKQVVKLKERRFFWKTVIQSGSSFAMHI